MDTRQKQILFAAFDTPYRIQAISPLTNPILRLENRNIWIDKDYKRKIMRKFLYEQTKFDNLGEYQGRP